MKKNSIIFFNSLKTSFSIIGAVIGAGFITGREIMRFFYGKSIVLTGIILFLTFFLLLYFLLVNHSSVMNKIIEKSNVVICVFNLIVIASMLGATDSLFNDFFVLNSNCFIFSLSLLIFSTIICIKGVKNLQKINFIVVPLMIIVLLTVCFFAPISNNVESKDSPELFTILGYVCMNCLLAQPFITQLKKEEKNFSPFFCAFLASIILCACVIFYLTVLNDECKICDIPLTVLAGTSVFVKICVILTIFLGIITTQFGAQYPVVKNLYNKLNGKFLIVLVCFLTFIISRIGFYNIVELIYPIIAIISIIYFLIILPILLVFFAVIKQKDTSKLQECIVKRY